jgi:TolB-like protein/Tfp pilus assembly protein PilF
MASLIPGFEYDIFISYRQKDNKHDGWVTDFVNSLKGELESTFKEEISVYFDINPHDGILETHDVDASLKEKLKCLVFIPVISHTYCDSHSFAWEHEFKAFITQASLDRFGLKITLHSGNVANRILPVRIHELDPEDRDMVENELGGTLRAIDFIYKEPGVNRPLTPADDENKNLCGTKYRNQINKTANAVKDIISSLQPEQPLTHKERPFKRELREESEAKKTDAGGAIKKSSVKWRQKGILLMTVLLIMAGFYATYKFSGTDPGLGRHREKSIAVLPFEQFGDDKENMWLGDAIAAELINQLSNIRVFSLRPINAVLRYKGNLKNFPEIGKEVNANYIIEGSYLKIDEKFRISVNLIDAKKNEQIWGKTYEPAWADMSEMHADIAEQIASNLKTVPLPEEKAKIEKNPTKNAAAYMNYLSANVESQKALSYYFSGNQFIDSLNLTSNFSSAILMYDRAIKDDPNFALAYAKRSIARSWGLHTGQLDESHIDKCKADADKAFEIEKDLVEAQVALGFYYYYCTENYQEAIAHFTKATEMDPDNYQPPFYMAMVYRKTGDWKKSQELITKVIEKEPQDALALINIGISFTYMHSYDTAVTYYRKAIDAMPGWSGPYSSLVEVLVLKYGNTIEARKVLDTSLVRTGERHEYLRVLMYIYEGRYPDALKELKSSTDEELGYPGLRYLASGWLYRLLNDQHMARAYNDSAVVVYKQMIMDNPENYYAYSSCGLAYAGSGNVTDALIEGKTAVELASDDPVTKSDMIINLGKIYIMTGDIVNATRQVDFLLNNPSSFSLNFMKVDPDWKKLAESPEFKAMTGKRTGTR